MPITFRCPHCGHQTEIAEQFIGQSGPCARCGQTVTVTAEGGIAGGAVAAAPPKSNSNVLLIVLIVGGVALLLVGGCVALMYWGIGGAIGGARQAAQRTMDLNNVKMITLGLHNYHDVNNSLPAGTAGPAELEPDQQLSWMAEVLPFAEQGFVYNQLDFDEAWDAPANRSATQTQITIFQSAQQPSGGANTDFVGIGGLGADAPTLPASDPRAGFFGYNRATKFGEVKDGLSNTMIVAETHLNNGPWAQGGPSTIRGLDTKRQPYIGQGAQFGGANGAVVSMGDASARVVAPTVDPKVLEALSTIAGSETVPPF